MQVNSLRETCDCCGKIRLLIKTTTVVTSAGYDWEDSLYYADCWRCSLGGFIYSKFRRIRIFAESLRFAAPAAFLHRAFSKPYELRKRVYLFKRLMKSLPR